MRKNITTKCNWEINLFFAFTIFIFAPIELYLTNINGFWFKISDVLLFTTPCFLTVMMISMAVFALLREKLSMIRQGLAALLFGTGLALYIQGNFINADYGILDGRQIDWSKYSAIGAINIIIWVPLIIIPVVLTYLKPKMASNIFRFLSLGLVGVQVLTLITLFISINFSKKNNITVTTNKLFELSDQENMIVFVVDSFDSDYMNQVLESYPEVEEWFEDFTYFSDTVAAYPYTRPAIPHILTGIRFDNTITYNDYLSYAYENTPLFKTLIDKNYNIGIYTGSSYFNGYVSGLTENIVIDEVSVNSYTGLGKMYYKLMAFRYFPHHLKKYVWLHTGEFDKFKQTNRNGVSLYYSDNLSFYNRLKSQGIKIVSGENAFRLYYIDGVHAPYTINEDIKEVGNTSSLQEAYASLKIVNEFISNMKEQGIYERANIVILADHGHNHLRQHALLLIKRSNNFHPFNISQSQVSFDDLMATFLDLLGANYDIWGKSVFELGTEDRKRYYYNYEPLADIGSYDYFPDMTEYVSEYYLGQPFLRATGTIYKQKKTIKEELNNYYDYKIGEELSFSKGGNGHKAVTLGGVYQDWDQFAWQAGKVMRLSLKINDLPAKDLILTCNIPFIRGDYQRVNLYVNEKFIKEIELHTGDTFKIRIPKELITGEKTDFALYCPDAYGDMSDYRVFGIGIKNIVINEGTLMSEEETVSYRLLNDELKIDFSSKGNSDTFINKSTDWYSQEESHRWSGKRASILFSTDEFTDIRLKVCCYIHKNSDSSVIMLNGTVIEEIKTTGGFSDYEVTLPKELLNKEGEQVISFVSEKAVSPFDFGEGADRRALGTAFKDIIIEKIK